MKPCPITWEGWYDGETVVTATTDKRSAVRQAVRFLERRPGQHVALIGSCECGDHNEGQDIYGEGVAHA